MIIDLFRGPGGWSQGLRTLGITDEHGIDNDPAAHATATAAGHNGELADITTLDPRDYTGELISGQIGSPPCPGFTPAGKGLGRKDVPLILAATRDLARGIDPATVLGMVRAWQRDERSALTLEPLHWALVTRPTWIALEQVAPVLPIWHACAEVLRGEGYNAWAGIVHAEQYRVPQTRTRAVMLASLNQPVGRPAPICSRYYPSNPTKLDAGVSTWTSMGEAFDWDDEAVMRSNYGTGGDSTVRGLRTTNQPAPTVTGKIGRNKWLFAGAGKTSQFTAGQRPRPMTLPAHTITGKGTAAWIKPAEQGAQVTVQEAAVLQTFPVDYPWQGNKGQQYQQVGNAVPPLLAAHLLAELGVGQLPATHQLLATA